MARLTFPDEGSRLVYRTAGTNLATTGGKPATVYSDAGATTPADIQLPDGTPVDGSVLTIDQYSRLPLFLGPDGADTVYVVVNAGPTVPVYARVDDRIDALESGGGPGTPGASAYEIAVENGFEGTEAEWLASLVGADGADGAQGPAGPTGATGAEGPQGDPGAGTETPATALGNVTGAVDLTSHAASQAAITATLTGDITVTLPDPDPTLSHTVTLALTQDGTGGRDVVLPYGVLTANGVQPTLGTTPGSTDVLTLLWLGTAWAASLAAEAIEAIPEPDPGGGPTATLVVEDSFDTYSTGDLPSTPWTQSVAGRWKCDGPSDVAYCNGVANATQDTGSRDHRVLSNLKTGAADRDGVSGVVLRYKDEQNYISFEYVWSPVLATEPSAWDFFVKANNVGREIKVPIGAEFGANEDHTLQVDAIGDQITILIDGAEWSDSPVTLTSTENTALGATATKAGLINFAGFGNFYDVALYTLTT